MNSQINVVQEGDQFYFSLEKDMQLQLLREVTFYYLAFVAWFISSRPFGFSFAFGSVCIKPYYIGSLYRSVICHASPENIDGKDDCDSEESEQNNAVLKAKQKRVRPRISVLQYHDDWVAVNKPAGITVHRSTNMPRRELVLSTLLKRQLARKVYPVHRLDHRTSGAILFAFDSKTCGLLHKALTYSGMTDEDVPVDNQNDKTESSIKGYKHYIALLRGDWRRKYGDIKTVTVSKPLTVKGIERDAETTFTLLSSYTHNKNVEYCPSACSLVLCSPKSGRFHQIRRHAQSISFPVIGDTKYGDTKVNRYFRENRGLNRLFLHCLSLSLPPISTFSYSGSDEPVDVIAPLPSELRSVLRREDMNAIWNEAVELEPMLARDIFDERGGTFGRNYRTKKENEKNL